MWDTLKGSKKIEDAFAGTALSVRCYESHPALKLGNGNLIGGSASFPVAKDADVYVALQRGSTSGLSSDPWNLKENVVEVHFGITDMTAPTDVPRFKKMVTWLCNQLQDGKTVHVGCIGGHGRTGLVISAIVAEMKGKKDAIQWVRKNYCKKAVESKEQIKFLMKHYGVTEVLPTKEGARKVVSGFKPTKWVSDDTKPVQRLLKGTEEPRANRVLRRVVPDGANTSKSFAPMTQSSRSLWRKSRI